jgi:hypothetical protein
MKERINHMALELQNTQKTGVQFPQPLTERELYERENTISKADGKLYQKYYIETKQYYTNNKVSSNCNAITFINVGSQAVTIENVVLQQGQQFKVEGNRGEIDTTQYIVTFPTPVNVNNNLVVVRKLYV